MKPRILAVLLANLFAISAANAQEASLFTGSVSLGGIGSNIDSKDDAKATEYRDLNSGGILNFDLRGRGGSQWVDLFGENVGRADQFIDLNGGVYGFFKGRFYLNDILHNHALDARTPYTGVGGSSLVAPVTGTGTGTTFNTNPDTWSTFDARIKRRNVGGYAEITPGGSFYGRVDANQARWSGIRMISEANGPSPTYGFVDLPTPVDYVVNTVSLEGGYSSKTAHVSLSVAHSKFSNENDTISWVNPNALGAIDTTVLPQDNKQTKWALNGVMKRLPLDSTLAARITYAKTENHVTMLGGIVNTASSSVVTPTTPNPSTFDGEIIHRTGAVSLTSQLSREFDSRVYYNQYKKENESTQVVFAGGLTPEVFGYDKKNLGVELGYRLPRQTRLILGYDHVDLDRERVDFDNTKDKKLYFEAKTGAWDIASIRVRVQKLERRSHFLEADAGTGPNDPRYLNRYVARFDASNVDQGLAKLALDVSPAEQLDFGLEAIFKNNDYKDTTLGRTKDRRSELYGMVSYGDRDKFRITAFADAEYIQYDSTHRNIGTVAGGPTPPAGYCTLANPNCFDPINGPSNSGSYNWDGKVKEKNYAAGVGADWVANPRLRLNASYTWQRTNGSVDLSSPVFPAPFVPLVNIDSVDDVTMHTLHIKGTYKATPKVDVTAGYAYEKYDYKDTAYDNYTYVVPGSTPNARGYLSGIFAYPNYRTNVVYVYVTYRF
jgi:MtrB/PioB family decaheme-associated outer membrane protein